MFKKCILIRWVDKWMKKLVQTICKNLEGEVRRNIPRFQGNWRLCFHGSSGCLCSVSHTHVPTFCPCSRGQARSTQEGSPFSSEKCSLLLLCILAPLMLLVKPGVSGISISTRLCERTPGQSCSWEECAVWRGCSEHTRREQEGYVGVRDSGREPKPGTLKH